MLPRNANRLVVVVLVLFLVSCIDEYWPEFHPKYEDILVVDGHISNQPGPYTIKLSTTSNVQYPKYHPLTHCQVIIEDDQGTSEELFETAPGVYITDEYGLKGESGSSYRIRITTPNEKIYITDFEEMPQPTGN